jgi:hypothetical protein
MRIRLAAAMLAASLVVCNFANATGPAAMIYGTDAVSTPDSVSLPTSNDNWFTQGNGTSVPGTQVPAYWVNKVGGEIDAAIEGLGLTLSMTSRNQLATILQTGFGGVYSGAPMPATANANTPSLGWSTLSSSAGNTPFFGDYGLLFTASDTGSATPATGNAIRQEAYDISATQPGPQWFRTNVNNAGWSAWSQVGTTTQIAAAQSAAEIWATNQAAAAQSAAETYANGTVITNGQQFPGGFTIQSGNFMAVSSGTAPARYFVAFSQSFANSCIAVVVSFEASYPPQNGSVGADGCTTSGFYYSNSAPVGGSNGSTYIAIGR